MTTNTATTITVTFCDSDPESVEAAYYQIEDGWVTFKTDEHQAVASYPAGRVTSIKADTLAGAGGVQ